MLLPELKHGSYAPVFKLTFFINQIFILLCDKSQEIVNGMTANVMKLIKWHHLRENSLKNKIHNNTSIKERTMVQTKICQFNNYGRTVD